MEDSMSKKHMLIMLACCLVPVIALGAIFLFHLPVNQVVFFLFILIWSPSHILIIKFMADDAGHEHSHHHAQSPAPDRGKIADRSS